MKHLDAGIEARIQELLTRMTIEEKAGQLQQWSPSLLGGFDFAAMLGDPDNFDFSAFQNAPRDYHEDRIRAGLIGSMGGVVGAETVNRLQRIAVEETRLGIPMLFGLDVIHGYETIFPTPLAEACSWEPELAERTAAVAAFEASAAGVNWTFAPMVDISRDARWGRVAEGAGEDVLLGSAFAAARVRGFQGVDLTDPEHIAACAKHYVAYGAALAGRDYNTTDMSEQMLRDVYLPPFRACVEAGAATFMSAFNDLNGVPCTANRFVMTDLLRDEMGFHGLVVSDANAVGELIPHGFALDRADAGRKALEAGVDIDMGTFAYGEDIPGMVRTGQLEEKIVDESVRRVLRVKFAMGLFECPYRTDAAREAQSMRRPEALALAREAARKSSVLLKNDGGLLPLAKTGARIAVVGPLADRPKEMFGTWVLNGVESTVTTVLDGIREAVGDDGIVTFEKGCAVNAVPENESDAASIKQAVETALNADVVIAVLGESAAMSGEAASRMQLGLPGSQPVLLDALLATGKPVVLVLMNGRPLCIPEAAARVPAILEAWQLGTEAGHAVADILFGDFSPEGRLVMAMPHAVGQLPMSYSQPATGRPVTDFKFTSRYLDGPNTPTWPFGWGLTYSSFQYEALTLESASLSSTETLRATVTLTNTGTRNAVETVQLYVRDLVGSRVRPVKELKAFRKVALNAGQSERITLEVPVSTLGFHDIECRYVVEPGMFRVFVGPNAVEGLEAEFLVAQAVGHRG